MLPAIALVALVMMPRARAAPGGDARVRLEVEAQAWQGRLRLFAETRWLGVSKRVLLEDHGALTGDVAGDGVWVAVLEGPPIQALPVRLYLQAGPGAEQLVYAGTELIQDDPDVLSWELRVEEEGPRAWRVARPLTGRLAPLRSERGRLIAAGLWGLLVLNYAAWLWVGHRRERA